LRRATVEITAHRPLRTTPETGPNALVNVEITLPQGPNTYRLRFVARSDGDGRLGTADIPIPGATPAKNTR
jgi:hypothetical protein